MNEVRVGDDRHITEVHVIPMSQEEDHEVEAACLCGPEREDVPAACGEHLVHTVWVHREAVTDGDNAR